MVIYLHIRVNESVVCICIICSDFNPMDKKEKERHEGAQWNKCYSMNSSNTGDRSIPFRVQFRVLTRALISGLKWIANLSSL